jgi:hypothetical protein
MEAILLFKIHLLKLNVFPLGKTKEVIKCYKILRESRREGSGENESQIITRNIAKERNQKRQVMKRDERI